MSSSKMLVDVLLAEGNDGHAQLTIASLREAGVADMFHRVRDGQEMLAFVQREVTRKHGFNGLPALVLVDIDLPGMNGIEVLQRLKADPRYSSIPVVVMTTASDPQEAQRCQSLGCDAYVSKWSVFLGLAGFAGMLRNLSERASARLRKHPTLDSPMKA